GTGPSMGVGPSGTGPSMGVGPSGTGPSIGVGPSGTGPSIGVGPSGTGPSIGVGPSGTGPSIGVGPSGTGPSIGVGPSSGTGTLNRRRDVRCDRSLLPRQHTSPTAVVATPRRQRFSGFDFDRRPKSVESAKRREGGR